jgi:hypothetical protein
MQVFTSGKTNLARKITFCWRHNKKSHWYGYQVTVVSPGIDKADLEAKQATTQECGNESQLKFSDFRNTITRP